MIINIRTLRTILLQLALGVRQTRDRAAHKQPTLSGLQRPNRRSNPHLARLVQRLPWNRTILVGQQLIEGALNGFNTNINRKTQIHVGFEWKRFALTVAVLINENLQINRHAVSTSNLELKITEAIYSCFIFVRNNQQCIYITSELRRELGTNGCESDVLAVTWASLILKGWLSTTTILYDAHIRDWILQATDF